MALKGAIGRVLGIGPVKQPVQIQKGPAPVAAPIKKKLPVRPNIFARKGRM